MEFEPSPEDLQHLREWIKKMPHLVQDYDDAFLAAFVRGCKGSLQKTKTTLENFNAMGMKYPELLGSLDPFYKNLQIYLNDAYMFRLPKKLNGDTLVSLTKLRPETSKENIDKSHPIELVRYLIMSLYIHIWENDFGPGKLILIFDFKRATISHLREFTPMALKMLGEILMTAVPIRFVGIHVINIPHVFEWIFNFLKSILPKKLGERVHVLSTLESLHSHIPKENLPKELGGEGENEKILHDNCKKKIESYRQRLVEEEKKMRALDGIRAKTMKPEEMIGTFKSLSVD